MRILENLKIAFPISAVWFGALIGPSMVSGTYVAVYFAPYGAWGVVLSYLCMVGICLIVALAANIVRVNQTYEYAHFAKVIYGRFSRFLSPVLELFMILAMVVGGSAVLSMSGSLLAEMLPVPIIVGTIAMAVIGILLDMKGAHLVRLSSSVMTPALIIGFFLLAGSGIMGRIEQLGDILSDWTINSSDMWSGVYGAVMLGFSNLGMVTSLCAVEQKVTKKSECIWIAVCSFLLNGTAFFLGTLFVLPYCPEVLSADVPAIYIIDHFIAVRYPWIRGVYLFVMFFALLSSSAPQLHAVSSRLLVLWPVDENQKKREVRTLIIGIGYMAACIIISTFGLFTIVSKGYAILAKLGIPIIALPIVIYSIRKIIHK